MRRKGAFWRRQATPDLSKAPDNGKRQRTSCWSRSPGPAASQEYIELMSTGHMHVLLSGGNLSCSIVEFSFLFSCTRANNRNNREKRERTGQPPLFFQALSAQNTVSCFGWARKLQLCAISSSPSIHQKQGAHSSVGNGTSMWRVLPQSKSAARCCNLNLRC